MKENNGKAARKKQAQQMMYLAGLMLIVTLLFMTMSSSNSSYGNYLRDTPLTKTRQLYNDVKNKNKNSAAMVENAQEFRYLLMKQFQNQPEGELLQKVLDGELNLMDLKIIDEDVVRAPKTTYGGVYGVFCKINFDIHKKDPSAVPMFRDIISKSPDCSNEDTGNRIYLDIHKVAQLIDSHKSNVMELTAVAFHESRCGSTLVANNLIAMNPSKHRVYSESTPALRALRDICGESYSKCNFDQAVEAFRDVIKVMSVTRRDSTEEHVFFKFQSAMTKHLEIFQNAFPKVPWMFIYRDPVQVIMSHKKDQGDLSKAICTRSKRNPPRDIQLLAHAHDTTAKSLSSEEYCAAHLAAITESAVRSLKINNMGIPINYGKLLDGVLWQHVLPELVFGRDLSEDEINNMKEISTQYSKGRGQKHGEYIEDSQKKEIDSTPAIHEAAKEYLSESFDALENYIRPKSILGGGGGGHGNGDNGDDDETGHHHHNHHHYVKLEDHEDDDAVGMKQFQGALF